MIDYFETKSQPISRVMVWEAFKEVYANKGGSGIDEMTWQWLVKNQRKVLYQLWNRLASGSYFPKAVREVTIPKKNGGTRKLGIPTLIDRIAQQVVRKHLEVQLEPHFHNSSYGYRIGRSGHDAVAQSCKNCFGHDFVIDLDIKGFFDAIDHGLLMKALRFYCKDKWVLLYVERWLKAGIIQQDGQYMNRIKGTPQGGVISPLLANLFLHVSFDKWMEKYHPEKPFERYADDIVVHCKTEKQAMFVLKQIEQRLRKCKLELHPTKTRIVNLRGYSSVKHPKSYDFLGFTIQPQWCRIGNRSMLMPSIFISAKSETAILDKLKAKRIHKRRIPIETLAQNLKPVLRGIINYFGKFSVGHLRYVCNRINARLLKWVKWEKGLYKMSAVHWLRKKWRANPLLFPHWKLVHP